MIRQLFSSFLSPLAALTKHTRHAGPRADVFSGLPVELMVLILQELRHTDVWRLRQVSKAWNTFLQQDAIVETALRRHETHDSTDAAHVPATLEARSAVLKAHHTGVPAAVVKIPGFGGKARDAVLKGKYLAYRKGYLLSIVNLCSGEVLLRTVLGLELFTITDTYLLVCTPSTLRYTSLAKLRQSSKSILIHGSAAVAGKGQLIAAIPYTGDQLTIYRIGWGHEAIVQIQLDHLPDWSGVAMVLDDRVCYVVRTAQQRYGRIVLGLTTVDIEAGTAKYRCLSFEAMYVYGDITCRLSSGALHVDMGHGSTHRHVIIGSDILSEAIVGDEVKEWVWARAGTYWKGNFYHDWLFDGPAIAIHKGLRRAGMLPCERSCQLLVNESFLVDVANMRVYAFDKTATACRLEEVPWVDSRGRETFKELDAARKRSTYSYPEYDNRERLNQGAWGCGCVVQ